MKKDKLIEVLSIQSESYNQFRMFAYIIRQLKKIDCQYYVYNGCIYVTKGEATFFPCVVSHMDTVHDIVEDLTVIEVGNNLTGFNSVMMEQTGIGGDDKCGIFIALQCLENFDNIKAVFFRDEETGCEGSYDCDELFFKDCGFILQCDRKGNNDFVTTAGGTKLSEKDFQRDIKFILNKHGYKFASGLMTDVMALKEMSVDCAMANISCGYYNPHCYNEYVNVPDVLNCLDLVFEIITTLQGKKYTCIYEPYVYQPSKQLGGKFGKWDEWDAWQDWSDYDKKKNVKQACDCCNESALLTYISEFNMDICQTCINRYSTTYIKA